MSELPEESLNNHFYISTNVDEIDEILGGGIPSQVITEIYGSSGVGKTQIALSIALNCAKTFGKVLYLSTDKPFPVSRLTEMSSNNLTILDSFHIRQINDALTQFHVIKYHIPVIMKNNNIKLIVIDSIASNYRSEESKNITERSNELYETGRMLKEIAFTFNAAVLVLNQVTEVQHSESFLPSGNLPHLKPSLGPAWAMCVNIRILISRVSRESKTRIFKLEHSPLKLSDQCRFIIEKEGIILDNEVD